jgi:hypothetical protein
MSFETYHFCITTRRFTRGATMRDAGSPIWGHNDVRDFGVIFTESLAPGRATIITSITSAQVNVSAPTLPNSVLATYTAGTAVNNTHPFLLTLGSGLDTFMTSVTEPKEAIGQFRLVTATGENRYPFTLYIAPKQATATTPDTASEDGYLTKSQTAGLYSPLEFAAGGYTIHTAPSGRRFKVYWHDDGTFHGDELQA